MTGKAELTVEFKVECADCGANLKVVMDTEKIGDITWDVALVSPCENCLDKAAQDAA